MDALLALLWGWRWHLKSKRSAERRARREFSTEFKADAVRLVAERRASAVMLRSIMPNHWYHHHGQLTVYLRELGVPLPSIYGPTADENPFG